MALIDCFAGSNEFLSNFYPCQIFYDGLTYSSTEAAYQAQKCQSLAERKAFCSMTALASKRAGHKVDMRADWESVKFAVMLDLLRVKFDIPALRRNLLNTGDADLVEGNYWHDKIWGRCTCARCGNKGANYLGRLLMQVRQEIRENQLS